MKILLASSEVASLAKTGGLADVAAALPVALSKLGHEVSVIMPAYREAMASGLVIQELPVEFIISIGNKQVPGRFLQTTLPGSNVPVYLVEQNEYFDRDGLYQQDGRDFADNCERFVFFSRAVMEAVRLLGLSVDVLHCNDWQTALAPAYLKTEYAGVPGYEHIASVFTIHNLAYQGRFWHWDMLLTGLDWKYFNWQQMEFYGDLNLMKTGLVFADALTTVSPRYAQEIQTTEHGCGMEGVLQHRSSSLRGILNGVDYTQWNPANDTHLSANYDADDLMGKSHCKTELQKEVGLPQDAARPLVAFVGRLADQKGLDLLAHLLQHWLPTADVQWVFLGTGQPKHQQLLRDLANEYPAKLAARIEFSNPLAHRIEAGADMFVMPSRYEPCGLNQLYSLKYGTVPVVRSTGGLANTVTDATEETLAAGTATGFCFDDYTPQALHDALDRACKLFAEPQRWEAMMRTGMNQNWSWDRSAEEYARLYQETVQRVRQTVSA